MKIKLTLATLLPLGLLLTASLQAEIKNPTILYVGDSHSFGKFGTVMEKKLSTLTDHVIMQASCGSTPSTWLGKSGYEKTVCGFWKKEGKEEIRSKEHKTPRFADELAKYRPEVSIVQLGTNIAAGSRPKNSTASIEAMMMAIAEEKGLCIWIGPPDANSKIVSKAKLKETNELLKVLSKKHNCHYIDSLALTKFPLKDKEGIHYSPTLSAQWGEKVSSQILAFIKTSFKVSF